MHRACRVCRVCVTYVCGSAPLVARGLGDGGVGRNGCGRGLTQIGDGLKHVALSHDHLKLLRDLRPFGLELLQALVHLLHLLLGLQLHLPLNLGLQLVDHTKQSAVVLLNLLDVPAREEETDGGGFASVKARRVSMLEDGALEGDELGRDDGVGALQ